MTRYVYGIINSAARVAELRKSNSCCSYTIVIIILMDTKKTKDRNPMVELCYSMIYDLSQLYEPGGCIPV